MIPQFKKLFLSLIFTVVLCCGLSVSASAVDYDGFEVGSVSYLSEQTNQYNVALNNLIETNPSAFLHVLLNLGAYESGGNGLFYAANADYVYCLNWSAKHALIMACFENPDGIFDYSDLGVYPIDDLTLVCYSQPMLFGYDNFSYEWRSFYSGVYLNENYALTHASNKWCFAFYDDSTLELKTLNTSSSYDTEQYCFKLRYKKDTSSTFGTVNSVCIARPYEVSVFPSSGFYVANSDVVWTYGATPTITATTSNVTDTTVDLAINVTGMDPSKTYNIRIDGTTADGEELSQVIGTITGEETYSTSATLGPFTPNTTYRATLVLLENGVDISSDLIEYTTLPPTYDPQITASQFSVTSTTMTSQVTLSGLDPSKQYRPYYRLSLADDDTVISQGYALDIMPVTGIGEYTAYSRINNLTANTEYRIIWALFEDGTEYVDAFDYFNFTTLDDGSGGGGSGSSDDNSGILLMILNKVSAILDTMNSGQSEGILASINEKLDALIDTLANPEEQQLEDNFKGSLTEVNNNFFGDTAAGQAVTVSDVGNLANTQGTVKNIFQSEYTVTDFFGIFSDQSLFAWFSAETAMDLNPNAYGGAALADLDDPYNMQDYYDNLEKVRGKK